MYDQLVTDLTALQTAVTAVQADVQLLVAAPVQAPQPGDPVWQSVENALTAGGWVAPAVEAPAPTDAPELPETATEDTTDTPTEA